MLKVKKIQPVTCSFQGTYEIMSVAHIAMGEIAAVASNQGLDLQFLEVSHVDSEAGCVQQVSDN